MAQIKNFQKTWQALSDSEKNSFYLKEILPAVSQSLHEQLNDFKKQNNFPLYKTLVTTLAPSINPTLLMIRAIQPENCVIFYTDEKENLVSKIKIFLNELHIESDFIKLDRINHSDNIAIIQQTIERYKHDHISVVCDITGGKKIISTQIGIIAHSSNIDIAYIDTHRGYIERDIPLPGSEILYILDSKKKIITELKTVSKLRVTYDAEQFKISFYLDHNGRSYSFGYQRLKEGDKLSISNTFKSLYSSLNNSIINNSPVIDKELKQLVKYISSMLLPKELKKFFKDESFSEIQLILDEELIAIPWELVLNSIAIQSPIFRVLHRTKEFHDHERTVKNKNAIMIIGSMDNIPFCYDELRARLIANKIDIMEAKNSLQLKETIALGNFSNYSTVIFFGHAVYGDDEASTGMVCMDGSIFSIEDCDVFLDSPPQCLLVNACQSAYGNLFSKHSLACAILKTGVQVYIGTHFLLEFNRSMTFLESFYKYISLRRSYHDAYVMAIEELKRIYGKDDISLYNYIYYGDMF